MKEIVVAIRVTIVTLAITGIGYPLAMTAVANLVFQPAAQGSLVKNEGKVVGSELIAQPFTHPAYFQPRPSAAGDKGYDGTSSGGSNLGPTSQALRERVEKEIARLQSENPAAAGPIPVELVTASGSGLDPHLSPEAARWQAPRVATARGVGVARVLATLDEQIEGRTWGVLGEPRVNVLLLNLALDRQFGRPR